ncbi:MAG: polysaccharide deacetylase family protein, partial [Candidatus Eisenbacteria bacterium]|nr:polysaccharide deacetylase family protein [Candidatus Latescibacterota bacterium]MBD3303318.1 polysaccharide deacetylase family protein [Candidatus Eisenbacteria bacterium]
ALGAGLLGIPHWHARRRRKKGRWGIVLRYHRVIPDAEPPAYYEMGIRTSLFKRQVDWIAERLHVVSLEELLWWKRTARTPPEDLVVLTFDDGYRDNLTEASPILLRHHLPATFYVTTDCLTERMPFWPETLDRLIRKTARSQLSLDLFGTRLELPVASDEDRRVVCRELIDRLRKRPMVEIALGMERIARSASVAVEEARAETPAVMNEMDLRSLVASGFSIGSHTVTHPYLPAEDSGRQERELVESRRRLEEAIGRPVLDFCYPGGGYTAETVRLAEQAGYRSAVTSDLGITGFAADPFRLPRVGVGRALATGPRGSFSGILMRAEVSGLFTALYRGRRRRATPPPTGG